MVNVFVLAFLCVNNEVLLLRRTHTGFGDGLYGLVGGKVEQGERALQAVKREVVEEVGLDMPESAFELAHVFHRKGTETELVALCFKVDISSYPAPSNNEPHKHDDMRFFNVRTLPENIISAHKQCIEGIINGKNYSEHGW